jgi:transposase
MSTQHGSLSDQSRRRLSAGDLILRGFDNDEIIEIPGVSHSSIKRWRPKVERDGLGALTRKSGSGRSSELTPEQLQELKAIIPAGYHTDRWTSRIVADLIRKKWGVEYTSSNVRRILPSLGLSYQKPDVKSTKHSPAAVEHWKRHIWPCIKKKRTTTVTS